MCGINGILNHKNKDSVSEKIVAMNKFLKHRGPDDEGIYCNEEIAFGQTRLSIIDLSSDGQQPMISDCGNIVLVFNGEIYNYRNLKSNLKYNFKTKTDSEVIIASYLEYGIGFIEKIDGMFAIALYDNRLKKTFLIRDRFGVKPIYYTFLNKALFFSSEQRVLIKMFLTKPKINLKSLKEYIRFATVIEGETFIEEIYTLKPGHYIEFESEKLIEKKYYHLNSNSDSKLNYSQTVEKTRDLVVKAVAKRLESDVPLAAFLSGGIDSSVVVASMSLLGKKANTFHVSFNENEFSESHFAKIVSKKFDTNHQEVIVNSNDFLNLIPSAVQSMDFPSLDGVNTYIVSKATKEQGITVALSGIGADEWFGGYPIFSRINSNLLKYSQYCPKIIRKFGSSILSKIKNDFQTEKFIDIFNSNLGKMDFAMLSRAQNSENLCYKLLKENIELHYHYNLNNISDLSILEWKQYLLPVLLRDADQMSMANALEVREPFMDHHLVEFILSISDDFKSLKPSKKLLIDAFSDMLPHEIINRKKMGFVLPYEIWCKENLKEFVIEGIDELAKLEQLNSIELEKLKTDFFAFSNKVRWTQIWSLSVLGHWIKNNL